MRLRRPSKDPARDKYLNQRTNLHCTFHLICAETDLIRQQLITQPGPSAWDLPQATICKVNENRAGTVQWLDLTIF